MSQFYNVLFIMKITRFSSNKNGIISCRYSKNNGTKTRGIL